MCGTKSRNTHYFFQVSKLARLKFVLSDTKFMIICSFSIYFKKMCACSKVLVVCKKKLYANTCLLVDSTKMNSADTFSEYLMLMYVVLSMNGAGMKNVS